MTTSKLDDEWPSAITNALQGITYWIGFNRCRDRSYHISEGALVDELRALIAGRMRVGETLGREVWYHDLLAAVPRDKWPSVFKRNKSRADIFFYDHPMRYVFEVKRYGQGITSDLTRLAQLQSALRHCRTGLILISQRKHPEEYVTDEGLKKKDQRALPNNRGHYQVSKVFKASPSLRSLKRESAHYACILEAWAR